MRRRIIVTACALLCAAALSLVAGCQAASSAGTTTPAYETYLYMTDSTNGHVYYYNPATHTGSSVSLLTTSENYAGEIKFYKGIGYVAMGGGGIYYFDPSASAPSATLLTGSGLLDAEYFAFYSSTKAYVSVVTSYANDTGAIYSFNPSSPSSGLTPVTSAPSKYYQEIIVGPDSKIYAAENKDSKVIRINPSTDAVEATITTNASGTTGLYSGTYNGTQGVFVANTGGSIDFIAEGASDGSTASQVTASCTSPGRLVQLTNGNLVVSGWSKTYLVTLSGSTASVSEIKSGTTSFAALSIAYDSSSGLVYVPTATYGSGNYLYVFDTSGTQQSYSPVSVMTSTDNIANVAFYQN